MLPEMLLVRARAALAIEGTLEVSRVLEFTAISICAVRSGILVANATPVIFEAVPGWISRRLLVILTTSPKERPCDMSNQSACVQSAEPARQA